MSADDNTIPPKPEADTDADKTILSPATPAEPPQGAAEEEADRTILASPAPAEDASPDAAPDVAPDEDADRTVLAGASDAPASVPEPQDADEADRTVLATPPPTPTPEADPDQTVLAAPAAPEDPDRTVLATPDADPDQTVLATPEPPSDDDDGGSVYKSAAEVTATFGPKIKPDADTPEPVPDAALPPLTPLAQTPLSSLEPGTIINNMYRVEDRLDQGGMGRVFRGVEIGTGEPVAIKVILPEMAEDAKVAQMFRREARTLRQLHHDAIVRYFAYVPPDEYLNLHALVMGFIEGTKLSDKLKSDGALEDKQVIKLARRLADGLERAHQIGIVHRDLSPDNVMLQGGDIGKAVLIDFGISRSSKIKDVTIGNEFAGKLKYVSPEQLGAFGGEAEGASDVYSLGLLMIAMLTGKPVPMGDTIVEAVQMRQTVPDLAGLPSDFQGILYAMLQPDPKDRLPSMAAVIEELRAIDDGDTAFGTRSRGPTLPTEPPVDRAVPGLQAVPIAATSSVTQSGTTPPSAQFDANVAPSKGGGRGMLYALFVALLLAAGGVFYLLEPFEPEDATDDSGDPVADGLIRLPDTPPTYLATRTPETCAFATLRDRGLSADAIEGFGADTAGLMNMGTVYSAAFGRTPEVVPREIPASQCAVLDFVRAFQGTRGAPVEITLDAHVTERGTGVVGRINGTTARQNWLALVDPNGRVFSLMRQLDDPIGDERRFSFRLPSAAPGRYLLIATASGDALVRAGAMQDGTTVGDILPLMLRELATDGQGAADIAYLELTR